MKVLKKTLMSIAFGIIGILGGGLLGLIHSREIGIPLGAVVGGLTGLSHGFNYNKGVR